MNKIYIGIDPGKKGAMAVINRDKIPNLTKWAEGYKNKLLAISYSEKECICCLEEVHSMPKQGVKSTFAFGENFGNIKGMLEAYEIPYQLVKPQTWKKAFGLIGKDKSASIECAEKLFPGMSFKKTEDGLAEALLMAEYARRYFK